MKHWGSTFTWFDGPSADVSHSHTLFPIACATSTSTSCCALPPPPTMVSFCCDACQSVVKKPKALAHLASCGRAGTLSCIDCGGGFTSQVRAAATRRHSRPLGPPPLPFTELRRPGHALCGQRMSHNRHPATRAWLGCGPLRGAHNAKTSRLSPSVGLPVLLVTPFFSSTLSPSRALTDSHRPHCVLD